MRKKERVPWKRIYARLAPESLKSKQRAAELQGRSVSDFMVAAAQEAAYRTIKESQVIRLSVADQKAFAEALLNPLASNDVLRRAAKLHPENVVGGESLLIRKRWVSMTARALPAATRRSTLYFRKIISQDVKRKVANCYGLVEKTSEEVEAFYSLSAPDLGSELPRYPVVPAVLIGWLGRDLKFRSQGIGPMLLQDAIIRIAGSSIGAYADLRRQDRRVSGGFLPVAFVSSFYRPPDPFTSRCKRCSRTSGSDESAIKPLCCMAGFSDTDNAPDQSASSVKLIRNIWAR